MKLINKIFSIALVALSAASISSCEKDPLLDLKPEYAMGSGNVWGKATLARQAVTGVYNEFYTYWSTTANNDDWNVQMEAYSSVMDIDRNWTRNLYNCNGTGTPSSYTFSQIFKYFYTFIFRANDVIDHIGAVPDMDAAEKAQYIAEAKFLRAFAYSYLNVLWRGVPLYMNYIDDVASATKPRSTEMEVWEAIVSDLTACIDEPNLPKKYSAGNGDFCRVTKGAAYAYRGQAYQFMAEMQGVDRKAFIKLALDDFNACEACGYSLFKGAGKDSFKQLLKPANEQCDEMIFQVACVEMPNMGNPRAVLYGNRCTAVTNGAWNNYLPNPAYVESFENADGSKFNWDDYLPGWSEMKPRERVVFFLRDQMTSTEISNMAEYGADMSKYKPYENEARIRAAYEARDPRLQMSVITPYSAYNGGSANVAHTYYLRWPYRGSDTKEPFDIRTDTNSMYYYLWRKYVPEGLENTIRWVYTEDIILCRYAEILLRKAECLNELGFTNDAVDCVNQVRERAGHIKLNSNEATTVKGQDDMRERIRNEFYWELGGEDSMYFNELRWGVWLDRKFRDRSSGQIGAMNTNGLMQMWGETTYTWYALGDYVALWPIPAKEREMNANLTQNPGWND